MQNALLAVAKYMHFNYNININQSSDYMTMFTQNWNDSTYVGSVFTPLHDFTHEALLTLSRNFNLPGLQECIA